MLRLVTHYSAAKLPTPSNPIRPNQTGSNQISPHRESKTTFRRVSGLGTKQALPSKLVEICVSSLAVCFISAYADSTGYWPGGLPTLTWLETQTQQTDLTFSISHSGVGVTMPVASLTVNTKLSPLLSGSGIAWNNPLNWDSLALPVIYVQNVKKVFLNGDEITISGSGEVGSALYDGLSGIVNGGPTETSVDIPVATLQLPATPLGVSFDLGVEVKFNVTIDGNRGVNLNQDATIESLSVQSGSALDIQANRTLTLKQNSTNSGIIEFADGGFVTGDGVNTGMVYNTGTLRKSSGGGEGGIGVGGRLFNSGTVEVSSGMLVFANFVQTAGTTDLKGGSLAFSSAAQILGGELIGSGTIGGSIINSAGQLRPGHSVGTLSISGDLTLLGNSLLLMELAGTNDWLYDQIVLGGVLNFGGALTVSLLDGFTPSAGNIFDLFDFTSSSGFFASTNLPSLPAGLVWDTSLLYTSGEIEAEQTPVLLAAASRKTHGGAGTFDLNLNLNPAANPTVEPRRNGPTQVLFTFNKEMMPADGTLDATEFVLTNATFVSASIVSSNLTLNLTNVVDQSLVTVVMNGISDLAGNPLSGDRDVVFGALYRDVNGSRTVDVVDFQQTKWRLGQTANSTNYWFDINCSGKIDVVDLQRIKWGFGNTLPGWPPPGGEGSQIAEGASGMVGGTLSAPLGESSQVGDVTQTFLSALLLVGTDTMNGLGSPFYDVAAAASMGGTDKSVCPTTLGEALGAARLEWRTNGDQVWVPTMEDGEWAAVRGRIEDYEVTWLETTVTGPGTITFQWKVSSELNADFLTFSIDGTDQPGRISGEVDWQSPTFSIPTGTHLLRWTYAKNRDKSAGLDSGWVCAVRFNAGP